MSSDPAPRPPPLEYAGLRRGAESAALVAALLSAAVGLRFLTHNARQRLAPGLAQGALSAEPSRALEPQHTSTSVAPSASHAAAGASASVRRGESIRVTLEVTVGEPRADVFVNRTKVGQSPFMGDVTCRAGERLRVELMPAVGAPRAYELTCTPGTLRIE